MSLEINEIELKMSVGNNAEQLQSQTAVEKDDSCCDHGHEAIVADCTRQVLQRLAQLQAR